MWKASIGAKPLPLPKPSANDDDDWDTDPNFVNDITEKESRWGSKTVQGSGHVDAIRLDELRDAVLKSDSKVKESLVTMPNASAGYGGKFGVERDRVDKCAEGFDYRGKVTPHVSQTDHSKGFGGQFGVQQDRQDKSAVGWTEREPLAKHDSQKDYALGFGGRHGVQTDRVDESAVGWSHHEKLEQHESQKDYKMGFGGEFGVQQDRKDKSAVGWDEHEKLEQHESQKDYKKGFGGQFGVQRDRVDKSAVGWDDHEKLALHESQKSNKTIETGSKSAAPPAAWSERQALEKHDSQQKRAPIEAAAEKGRALNLRSKFEQLAVQNPAEDRVRAERERRKRDDEELRRRQAEEERRRQAKIDAEWAARDDDAPIDGGDATRAQKTRPSSGTPASSDSAPPKPVRTSAYLASTPDVGNSQTHEALGDSTNSVQSSIAQESSADAQSSQIEVPHSQAPFEKASFAPRMQFVDPDAEKDDYDDNWSDDAEETLKYIEYDEQQQPTTFGQWQRQKECELAVAGRDKTNDHESLHQVIVERTTTTVQQPQAQARPEPIANEEIGRPQQDQEQPVDVIESHRQHPHAVHNSDSIVGAAATGTQPTTLTAVALFDYERQDDDEIGFEVNDIITDIEQIDVGWWRGTCRGRYGLFPANYVELRR